ncbi:MAG: dihydrolipoamide acetyltransferase family protein [Phycisphaerales bacterium]
MPIQITMPRLSDTMEQGTIVSWNVKEGDSVSAGDVLGDIETDKATMELQNFDDGVVAAILLKEGETVTVGKTIMVLAEEGEDPAEVRESAKSGDASAAESNEQDAQPVGATASQTDSKQGGSSSEPAQHAPASNGTPASGSTDTVGSTSDGSGGRIFVSPLARKMAEEKGVSLGSVRGSGPSGRIVARDIESAASSGAKDSARHGGSQAPAPLPVPGAAMESRTQSLSNMRATIAKRLVESKTTIPHYQVTMTVRMDALMDLREQLNTQLESQGVKLSVNDFLVRACAIAMHQHPFINASWGRDGQSVELHGHINVGVAISLPMERGGGLVVATIRDADRIGLRQISSDTKALAKKAREKGLSIEEMSDSTFTISNLGMFGVEHFTAIINPPNSAILAVGGAVKKPVVRTKPDGSDEIVVGHEMQMTMSSDHRVIDGAMAAEYLQTVKQLLEAPATLLV